MQALGPCIAGQNRAYARRSEPRPCLKTTDRVTCFSRRVGRDAMALEYLSYSSPERRQQTCRRQCLVTGRVLETKPNI